MHKQERRIGKKKAGPVEIAPPRPHTICQIFQVKPGTNNVAGDLPTDLRSQIKPFRA
jgi:hypothetical protein